MAVASPSINFIQDGSKDCPILQISGTDLQTSRELFHAIRTLRDSMAGSFIIHEVFGFENCKVPALTFEISHSDIGVQKARSGDGFTCTLSYDGWTRVEDFLAPFCSRLSSQNGFQWLDESSEISLLYSPCRAW